MDGDSEESVYNHDELTRIIHSNHQIRHMVQQKTNEFLSLQRDFFKALGNERFDSTLEQKSKLLTDSLKLDSLNEQVTADKVQLALVGENSCGKTALVHFLLDSGQFLPSDVGSVSARVIRLTYASNTEACLHVYESLEKRNEEPTDQISLRDCFLDSEPDWNALKNVIESYVKRPDAEKVEKDSYQFAEWAKRFVEIRIPSKFLKLGIDLYDTPGLLYSDPPILKKNLHDLVKLIRPTVVFMYENPSVSTVTKDCFLALKEALGKQLEDTNIFFLNTKVDIGSLITNGTNISKTEFEIIILNKARQTRKDLLLKAPGMTQEIDDNNGFNIISVDSGWSPLGEIMNKITINHIIQFVANADLKVAKTISKSVLSVINTFFKFTMVTNHRTLEQLKELRQKAHQWTNDYFIEHRNRLDATLRKLFDDIINELNENMDSIIRRAANKGNAKNIRKYIKILVQQEIIRVQVKKFIDIKVTHAISETLFNPSILNNADKNELIVAAQQMIPSELLNTDDETSCQLYICMNIIESFILIRGLLIETDDEDEKSNSKKKNKNFNELKCKIREKSIKISTPLNNATPSDIAQQYLNDIRSGFINQKNYLNEIFQVWSDQKASELHEKIDQQYELAEKFLPQREKVSNTVNKYAEKYAYIECKMIMTRDLMTFNGHSPTVDSAQQIFANENRFCEFYPAEWFEKKNLIVKKIKAHDNNLKYLDAHYHRKVTQLDHLRFLQLLHLYENENNELWMFFPKYESVENNIETLTVNSMLKIILTVAQCIENMHASELVHGNISMKNVFHNGKDEYLLGDFFLNETYDTLAEYVDRHNINKTLEATANDILSLGNMGLLLFQASKSTNTVDSKASEKLKSVLEQCLDKDTMARPKISSIVLKLKNVSEVFRTERSKEHSD